jgi:tetratricopeptide (TPR) repeat protein
MKLALLALVGVVAFGQSERLAPGFEHFYNLNYDASIREFRAAAATRPNDPNAHNHVAQALLYRDMFRAGALESELVSRSNSFLRRANMNVSEADAREFTNAIDTSMRLANERLAKDPNNVQALYSLGVAHGLRANYNFLVRKAWMDSLRDASTGRKHHNRITELDPNFIDARLMQGVHDYVVGSLPRLYRMLGFLAGVRGDREEGIKTLQLVAEKGKLNKYDAQVLLAVIYRREKNAEKAVPLLRSLIERFPRNYLLRLELAQMFGDSGDKENALAVFRTVEELKQRNAPGFESLPFEKIYFYRGTLLFWYNDLDSALDQMRRVTPKARELDLNTGVMSWMRTGQIYDLKGQRKQAIDAYKQAVDLAPQSDVAKEPRQYMSSPYKRQQG